MFRSLEFLDEGCEGWEGGAEALYFSPMAVPPWSQMFLIGELLG